VADGYRLIKGQVAACRHELAHQELYVEKVDQTMSVNGYRNTFCGYDDHGPFR
jgi:hypothetical protein